MAEKEKDMTILEAMSVSALMDFVERAKEQGLCYNGADIPHEVQYGVIRIVDEYISNVVEKNCK